MLLDGRQAPLHPPEVLQRLVPLLGESIGARLRIGRWAPPSENDTGAYARQVARALGVGVDDVVDLQDPCTLSKIVPAIVQHENGQQPYPADLIDQAVRLALE